MLSSLLPAMPSDPLSRAVQVTVVVPVWKVMPEGGTHTGLSVPAHRSLAVAVKVTTAGPEHDEAVIDAGQVIVGGVVSTTLTLKLQLASLPLPSLTMQFTGVVPRA